MDLTRYRPLLQDNGSRLMLLVVDGIGGYPDAELGSELEQARTPNLDRLAAEGITGLLEPAGPGITVGSGPGHLALFGYDPWEHDLGRGILAAVGLEFPLQPGDVAARGNLAVLDDDGRVTDRRAGRIPDDEAAPLVERVAAELSADGGVPGDVEVHLRHVSEHRVLLVLRGEGLDPRVADIDPQTTGVPPLEPRPLDPAAQRTADVLAQLDVRIRAALDDEGPDVILFRGFDALRDMPDFTDRTGLRAGAIASYPMYRGVASLVGMTVLGHPTSFQDQIDLVREHAEDLDYLFVHHKYADAAGHDGDRSAKVTALEALDEQVPALIEAGQPDVLAVTGDHACPTAMAGHSWHPVPALLRGTHVGVDRSRTFGERECAGGLLGLRPTEHLLPLMLGAAGRLAKYGA